VCLVSTWLCASYNFDIRNIAFLYSTHRLNAQCVVSEAKPNFLYNLGFFSVFRLIMHKLICTNVFRIIMNRCLCKFFCNDPCCVFYLCAILNCLFICINAYVRIYFKIWLAAVLKRNNWLKFIIFYGFFICFMGFLYVLFIHLRYSNH
jgi:hypothetical protein